MIRGYLSYPLIHTRYGYACVNHTRSHLVHTHKVLFSSTVTDPFDFDSENREQNLSIVMFVFAGWKCDFVFEFLIASGVVEMAVLATSFYSKSDVQTSFLSGDLY